MNYKQLIEAAGGEYVGEMKHCNMHLVLFNTRYGTTLALRPEELTGPEAVAAHIQNSDKQFEEAYARH